MATLSVCVGCSGGADLALALKDDGAVQVDCMNVCDKPACISLREDGKAAYLFGNVSAEMAGDVRMLVTLYDAAPTGVIEDARPLGKLRSELIGRIPA